MKERPTIVCLCGSTRFKDAFDEANYHQTMAGKIVLSVGFYMHATGNRHGDGIGATPEQKIALDELHKRKIDLADEVLVLNVGGYIGESTRSEIHYALEHGKQVRFLENVPFRIVWESLNEEERKKCTALIEARDREVREEEQRANTRTVFCPHCGKVYFNKEDNFAKTIRDATIEKCARIVEDHDECAAAIRKGGWW